jgi:hypothetical protein
MDGYEEYRSEFQKREYFDPKNEKKNFLRRFTTENEFLSIPNTQMTKKKMHNVSNHPIRITAKGLGSIHLPIDQIDNVLICSATDAKAGSQTFWNQIALEDKGGIRFCIDIDCKKPVSKGFIEELLQTVYEVLKLYYPESSNDNPIPIHCAVCGPRLKKGTRQMGIHIVTHVRVKITEARQLCYVINLRMEANQPAVMKDVELDDSIYKPHSKQCTMRMIYSSKLDDCPACDADTVDCCGLCNKTGMMATLKNYVPTYSLNPITGLLDREVFEDACTSYEQMFKTFSIWSIASDIRSDFKIPKHDPMLDLEPSKKTRKPTKQQLTSINKNRNASWDILEQVINDVHYNGEKPWEGIIISGISMSSGNKAASIRVRGIGSQYCLYAQKSHSNHIWFSLSSKGNLIHKCYSDNDTCSLQKGANSITFEVDGEVVSSIFGRPKLPAYYDRNYVARKKRKLKKMSDPRFKTPKEREKWVANIQDWSSFYKTLNE